MSSKPALTLTIGAIVLSLALDALIIYLWRRTNRGRSPMAASAPEPALGRLRPVLLAGMEVAGLILLSVVYAYPLLDFSPDLALPGETEVLTGIAIPVVEALRAGTAVPLWNPYVQHGKSLIADPFLFVFNPFVSLPMLLLGVNVGAKVAAVTAFALAGVGMWTLMHALRARGPARVWCGATYMLAGGMPAHLWGGHFQLAVGLAWVPWCFAGILHALERRTRRSIALAALAPALLFLTGNLYIPLYVLIGLAILFVTGVLHRRPPAALRERTRVFVLVGLFALGLIAVQLLPEWAARSYIHKGANPDLEGSQTVSHLLTNYLIGDPTYYDYTSLENLPYVQEYYNYIGAMPFALLIFLIPAARRRRWVAAAFALYFAFLLAWGAARFTFLRRVFSAIPFLYRFQFPARALRVGAFALILLAGLGLEDLWLRCRALRRWPSRPRLGRVGRALLMAGVLVLAGRSVLHLYQVNRPLLKLEPLSAEMDEALAWLASHDSSEYAVADAVDPRRQAGTYAHYRHHLRSLNVTLGWTVADVADGIAPDAVRAAPKYVVVPAGLPFNAPGGATPHLVKRIRRLEVWRIPDVLPFAFTVPFDRMQERGASLSAAAQVTERTVSRPSPNEIEVLVVNAGRDELLVVLESWFPGWRVSVDGRPGLPLKVDRFLGVRLSAGTHQVTFRYAPLAFKAGLAISLGTACALAAYALSADRWLHARFAAQSETCSS